MLSNRSIAFKLILVITVCCASIFTAILGYNYYRYRIVLQQELESNARNLALSSVNRLETVLTAITKVTEGLARSVENNRLTHRQLNALLLSTLKENPEIYGCGAAFEPPPGSSRSRPDVPYYRREGNSITYDPEDSFNYLREDWYQISREMNRKEWTEPYYDAAGTSALMATCSVPFYQVNKNTRKFGGVVVADVSLDWLTDVVASIKVLETGYAFLISRNGTIVTHPARDMIMNETIFSIAEARKDRSLRDLGRKMIGGESDFIPYTDIRGTRSWLYYAPIPSVGWTLAVVFPEKELMAKVTTLSLTGVVIGLVGIALLALVVVLIARSITAPLHLLAGATAAIAHGEFDIELPAVRSQDEVGTLSRAFLQMKNSLREHIRKLTETTAAKERIESELNIAHDIQMGLLPKVFPPFPERTDIDVYATMAPAREVGGDFYDFFFIDDRHLCFIIADVSGKGVPAALFMAMSMALFKATARYGLSPDQILSRVNNELARENDSCMFVTAFLGILDTGTGELIYANGGHNPPLHLSDGEVTPLPTMGSLVVGAMEDVPYRSSRLLLRPGDSLFLHTDGVNEAMNTDGEIFSDERVRVALSNLNGSGIEEAVCRILEKIRAFTGDAPQSDDITMMMIRYLGEPENEEEK